MSGNFGLDHRSSLRKLAFPASCVETLRRLYHQCTTFARKQPSPKEIEVVLDALDEFIFSVGTTDGNKSNRNSNSNNNGLVLASNPAIQELQMLQTLVDFFENDNSGMADIAVFNAMFRFLFMEPPKKKSNQARNRITIMAKLISLAMGIQSKILLNCTGNWLQLDGPTSERSMELVNILVTDYILLLPSQEIAWENLKQLPEISPVFVENFICAVSELYYTGESVFRPPPANVLELVTAWVSKHPLVLVAGSMNRQQSGLASPASVQTPIVGLAKWSVLGGLFAHEPEELYSSLHLALLQGLTEVQRSRRNLKSEVVAVKRVNLLIQKIEMALDHDISNQEKCLDRLGQFLQAITAAECLSGKTVEIINALKRLPSNKLIQMYVVYLAGVN